MVTISDDLAVRATGKVEVAGEHVAEIVGVPAVSVAGVEVAGIEIHIGLPLAECTMPTPPRYNAAMDVELTPDQRDFVRQAIESGRISGEEEAIRQALALWEERERRRLEILAMVDEADASLARGEGIPITDESMKALAEDVKREGRRRLAAERQRTTSR